MCRRAIPGAQLALKPMNMKRYNVLFKAYVDDYAPSTPHLHGLCGLMAAVQTELETRGPSSSKYGGLLDDRIKLGKELEASRPKPIEKPDDVTRVERVIVSIVSPNGTARNDDFVAPVPAPHVQSSASTPNAVPEPTTRSRSTDDIDLPESLDDAHVDRDDLTREMFESLRRGTKPQW
jgi:hypothetical protein